MSLRCKSPTTRGWILLITLLTTGLPAAAQGTGTPGEGIFLPFDANQTWYVCQGHLNVIRDADGEILVETHRNNYSLDLTIDPEGFGSDGCYGQDAAATGASAGEPVYAPGPGVTTQLGGGAQDLLCLDLDRGGSLLLGHMDPQSIVADGRVEALELLGYVDEPTTGGGANNGGYSHIHIEAFGNDGCEDGAETDPGAVEPHADAATFEGQYKFFGVPDLPDLRAHSAVTGFENHYFGTGLSNLKVAGASDDAGREPVGCTESNGFREIYLGNCSSGAKVHSGLRFENLPVGSGEWISTASLVLQVDGPYSNVVNIDVRGHETAFPSTFYFGAMPSDRLDNLTSAVVRWTIDDPWQWRDTRETTNLRTVLQEIVDLWSWTRGSSDFALILSGVSGIGNNHRRFMAVERDPTSSDPELYPARAVVTQFQTDQPGRGVKGNNRPVADAGPDRTYTEPFQVVTLDGSGSFDPDGDEISYLWTKISGPPVIWGDRTAAVAQVTTGYSSTFIFELQVTDDGTGELRSTDRVVVIPSACGPPYC